MIDFVDKLYYLPGIVLGLSLHEFGHAITAFKLGDPTPRNEGRITISPAAHIDPIGLLFFLFSPIGWAKPVHIQPRNFSNPKRDQMLVSFAGPFMNLLVGIMFLVLIKVFIALGIFGFIGQNVAVTTLKVLYLSANINFVLMLFNLLPLGFLDGYKVLSGILPSRFYTQLQYLETYGMHVLIGLILLSYVKVPILDYIIFIPASFLERLVLNLLGIRLF